MFSLPCFAGPWVPESHWGKSVGRDHYKKEAGCEQRSGEGCYEADKDHDPETHEITLGMRIENSAKKAAKEAGTAKRSQQRQAYLDAKARLSAKIKSMPDGDMRDLMIMQLRGKID